MPRSYLEQNANGIITRNVGIEAASTLSSCVPDSFVFAVKVNEYHWDMFVGMQT